MNGLISTKDDYLKNGAVQSFLDYLKNSIDKFPHGAHSYELRGKNKSDISRKHNFEFEGLKDAAAQYHWNGTNLNKTINKMQAFKKVLDKREHIDERYLLNVCLDVMSWGGVPRFSHDIAKRYCQGELRKTIDNAGKYITGKLDEESLSMWGADRDKIPMDSGWTKIYAVCFENHVIYDSRVALGLAALVRNWGLKKSDKKTQDEVKQYLGIRIPPPQGRKKGRKPIDDPQSSPVKFPWKSACSPANPHRHVQQHAAWNIRTNWMIESVMTDYSVTLENRELNLVYEKGSDQELVTEKLKELAWLRHRVIEMALFMIGYDISSVCKTT